MLHVVISVFAFLVAISCLVVVHEFGHFWVARRFGIKVERFSVGFGKPLFRTYDKLGTEYVLSSIPLGGYVALFGERGQTIPRADQSLAFSTKPVWVRMLVILAGPLFNFLFAILAYWVVFLLGISVLIPVLGKVPANTPASLAGLHQNQEIVSIEDHPTNSWEDVSKELLHYVGEEKAIDLTVKNRSTGKLEKKVLDLSHWETDASEPNWLVSLGLTPMDPVPAEIAGLLPEYPAEQAGLQIGDVIVAIDGVAVHSRSDVAEMIQARPAKNIEVEVRRHDQVRKLMFETGTKENDDRKVGFIGIEFVQLTEYPQDMVRLERFGVLLSLQKAIKKTGEFSLLTLEVLKKMILGKMSARHINGPLVIADHAGKTVMMGLKKFLDFLALISVSLGVLNLLPIPLLDGGHFFFCVIEWVTGRSVPNLAYRIGMWAGGILLVAFMMLAFYNDLLYLLR